MKDAVSFRVRKASIYDKKSNTPFKISRSKFFNFLSCKKCFYLDRVKGLKEPSMPGWALNIAVDELLKKEFDIYRKDQKPHPIMTKHNLNYIKLDGTVGCMVNGAGLAMGTMDIIKLYGGEPANFLDVGGVANAETVAHGFKIILSDPNVKSILINIFGGIVRCDRVAQGVIDALAQVKVTIPVIIRLEGTNAIEARNLLKNAEHDFIVASSLADAAEKAVKATGEDI